MSKKLNLTKDPIWYLLGKVTIPASVGSLFQTFYNLVDTWFAGRISAEAIGAIAKSFPIYFVIIAVGVGIGAATNACIGNLLGEKKINKASLFIAQSVVFAIITSVIVTLFGLNVSNFLLGVMGSDATSIALTREYLDIIFYGTFIVMIQISLNGALNAQGDTKSYRNVLIFSFFLNIFLNPLFIFGFGPIPAMGLKGAAMAALIARGAIFLGTIYLMHERIHMLTFRMPKLRELQASWKDILHVGIPAAGTNAIIPIAMALITAMLAQYGTEAVAGFGVASRIESLVLVMFYALSAIIGPFIGQNLSAGKADRIHKALYLCLKFCMSFGLIIALFLLFMSDLLPSLFSDNIMITETAALFLLIAPISYGAYGVVMAMNAAFNGMGKPGPAVIISMARMIVIYVPLAYLLQYFFAISGIFIAYALANILSAFLAYRWAVDSVSGQIDKMS